MTLPFAQLTPQILPPLVWWIAGFSLTLLLLNQALTFYKTHMREQPTPSHTYATKTELNELRTRVDGLVEKIDASFKKLDEKRSESIGGLHLNIDGVAADLRREMIVENRGLHNRITEILGDLRELKGRVTK